MSYDYDAVVVGSGPNGLAAAITLAQAGWSVYLAEAKDSFGGGMRTAELTLPGFKHDICSAIHPTGIASPFFRQLPLEEHGLRWIQPDLPLAHPFDDGTAAILDMSIDTTAASLGDDAKRYSLLMNYLVKNWEKIIDDTLRPIRIPPHYPFVLIRFGLAAGLPANLFSRLWFKNDKTRAMFAGLAAHSVLPMEYLISASFGLMLGLLGHAVGWPMPEGGSGSITRALVSYLESLGGELVLNNPVQSIKALPHARAYLFNTGPRQLAKIAGDRLPSGYRSRLEKYRYGMGVFKMDWALDGPIPWTAPECARAGTVHLGGSLSEIAASERVAWRGQYNDKPFVLLAQQSAFDATRAPEGKHTAWAYCHVPNGSAIDRSEQIENQIERFAPGFKARILKRHTMTAQDYERHNANFIGGDIVGGAQTLIQMFLKRPTFSLTPYTTPAKDIYLCSAATPPGGGVHGMAGYLAAQRVLKDHG